MLCTNKILLTEEGISLAYARCVSRFFCHTCNHSREKRTPIPLSHSIITCAVQRISPILRFWLSHPYSDLHFVFVLLRLSLKIETMIAHEETEKFIIAEGDSDPNSFQENIIFYPETLITSRRRYRGFLGLLCILLLLAMGLNGYLLLEYIKSGKNSDLCHSPYSIYKNHN